MEYLSHYGIFESLWNIGVTMEYRLVVKFASRIGIWLILLATNIEYKFVIRSN